MRSDGSKGEEKPVFCIRGAGVHDMIVTRHISLDGDHIEKMRPYLEKYSGNFGAALREMISAAAKPPMNSSAADTSFFNWALSEVEGILVPDSVLDEAIDPALINSMEGLEEYLRFRFKELGWDIGISLRYDSDVFPSEVSLEVKGAHRRAKFAAGLVAQYLVKNSLEQAPLGIKKVTESSGCTRVELSRSSESNAQKSRSAFFGERDGVMKVVKSRPSFWKAVVSRHLSSNYNVVTVHRNYFEDVLANKVPLGETEIEALAKRPLREIPLEEMLSLIKEVYESSRIADRVDIDRDTIALFHSFRTEEAVEKLKESLAMLLEANGHSYDATSVADMIVLRRRGAKLDEIVGSLKESSSAVDQELVVFLSFLKGAKDIPDIPLSLASLGRGIGASLMSEYEKENGIKSWSLENFRTALETIDSRLCRVSEVRQEGNSLVYAVKKCNLAAEGNAFNRYICHTVRELFKGALEHAFGNRAKLDINKLVTHGDNFCEVVIRIQ